jgi:CubicO group peptidase (beta-lactamase class C family)
VSAGSAPSVTMPTDTITLTGTASDDGLPSGSSISYTWSLVTGPPAPNGGPSAIIATPGAASTSVRLAGGAGDYTFSLKASDGALDATSNVTVTLAANPNLYPAAITSSANGWTTALPAAEGMDAAKLLDAKNYSLNTGSPTNVNGQTRSEAAYIIRHGKLVYSWGTETQLFEMKSTTKSMGGLALLMALDEGKVALSDKAHDRLPVFGTDPLVNIGMGVTGSLSDITVLQLATHTSGLSKSDLPPPPTVSTRTLQYNPGTTWAYSDQGLNWLADVLTQTYNQDLSTLMNTRVYGTLGIRPGSLGDLTWRDNASRGTTLNGIARRELASGISADVNAMARVGLLMLRQGAWGNTQLLSNAIVTKAHTPPPEVASANNPDTTNYPGATTNYGMLWWTNANGQIANVPKDAFWAWGLHETFVIVIPSQDLVIARAADAGWHSDPEAWNADYSILAPFLQPISASVTP